MSHLQVDSLSKTFITPGGREVPALRDISFSLQSGQILSVIGHNGSGKTTLLNCLRRAFPWDQGEILVDDTPVTNMRSEVVSVFQDVGLGVVGSMTPLENLSLVFSRRPSYLLTFPEHRFQHDIHAFLKRAGLQERFESFENTPVSELSGGERQQVAIIMAMMRSPSILLLDEFVANLDPTVRENLLRWTRAWIREHRITTVMVTHDHELAESWGDHVLELSDGHLVRFEKTKHAPEGGPA
ncbi:MAG: ABC transporter ATP-binding protein [Candidatus Nealsonbacteria bacterium]|nr:ABC transporter ATP-binding protein [Candidatus Nealsonbacteria bacterium]